MYKVKMKLTAEELGLLNWMMEMVDLLDPLNVKNNEIAKSIVKNNEIAKSIKTKMKVKATGDDKKI